MKLNDAFPSKYMKADDIEGQSETFKTIQNVVMEDVGQENDRKPIMYFEGAEQCLVMNKTKWSSLEEAFGADSDNWKGKSVGLSFTKVPYAGKMVGSIAVRPILETAETSFG